MYLMETKMITGEVIVVATAELMKRRLNNSLGHRTSYKHRAMCIRYKNLLTLSESKDNFINLKLQISIQISLSCCIFNNSHILDF